MVSVCRMISELDSSSSEAMKPKVFSSGDMTFSLTAHWLVRFAFRLISQPIDRGCMECFMARSGRVVEHPSRLGVNESITHRIVALLLKNILLLAAYSSVNLMIKIVWSPNFGPDVDGTTLRSVKPSLGYFYQINSH